MTTIVVAKLTAWAYANRNYIYGTAGTSPTITCSDKSMAPLVLVEARL